MCEERQVDNNPLMPTSLQTLHYFITGYILIFRQLFRQNALTYLPRARRDGRGEPGSTVGTTYVPVRRGQVNPDHPRCEASDVLVFSWRYASLRHPIIRFPLSLLALLAVSVLSSPSTYYAAFSNVVVAGLLLWHGASL